MFSFIRSPFGGGASRRADAPEPGEKAPAPPPHDDADGGDAVPPTPDELWRRFDGLPIHRLCREVALRPSDATLFRRLRRSLRDAVAPSSSSSACGPRRIRRMLRADDGSVLASGARRDCYGMTPLHVLAGGGGGRCCLEAHRLVADAYPESLIAEDNRGDTPLVRALRSGASPEVVELLVERHATLFPHRALDWIGAAEAAGGRGRGQKGGRARGCGSAANVRQLLTALRASFPEQRVDWQGALTRWAEEDTGNAGDPRAPKFHPDAFKLLMKFGVADRLERLGDERRRRRVLDEIDSLRWFVLYRRDSAAAVFARLERYERLEELREATSVVELAMWREGADEDGDRKAGRVRCGAEAVVPNLLPFLLPPAAVPPSPPAKKRSR